MADAAPRTHVTNVLVIGSGGAGLRAAIAAHTAGVDVHVVGKRPRKDAHTVLAAGGINAALGTRDAEDTPTQHAADTLIEGYLLGDPRTIELLCEEAPAAIAELDEWGMPFARTEDGQIDQRFFGAHTYRRTCFAGDYTGRAIIDTLVDRVDELGIAIEEGQYVASLLVHDGRCYGAMAFDIQTGARSVHLADSVVLAAGGHTRLWRRSSSRRDENTGDAMGLALAAGCRLADMELVQFHPTGMLHPEEWAGVLVTEAVRGEGGRLFNSEGERFMERYDADRMELSTRDRVALANYTEIQEGRGSEHGGVLLDVSHLDKELILERIPRMYRQFLDSQMLDISKDPMEVAPTAHYSMGGIVVEPESHATDVEGLYAAGEATTGVHGANRLGGNSLVETLVFGRRAGAAAAAFSESQEVALRTRGPIDAAGEALDALIGPGDEFARPLQREVRNAMWEHGGVVRDADGLARGLERLDAVARTVDDIDVRPTSEGWLDLAYTLDLRGALLAARATLMGAAERTETRGAHVRADHPELDEDLRIAIDIRLDGDQLVIDRRELPPIPEHIRTAIDRTEAVEVEGRLLE